MGAPRPRLTPVSYGPDYYLPGIHTPPTERRSVNFAPAPQSNRVRTRDPVVAHWCWDFGYQQPLQSLCGAAVYRGEASTATHQICVVCAELYEVALTKGPFGWFSDWDNHV